MDWKVAVSETLKASFCAKKTATFLIFGLIFSACLMAFGATSETGAETRVTNAPICGDALRGVRWADDGHLRLVGDRVGGECLLGERRADDTDDFGLRDQRLVGVDRALLVARCILEDHFDRPTIHAATVIEELLGEQAAVLLFLTEQRDIAGRGDREADRDRLAGKRRRRRCGARCRAGGGLRRAGG